MGCAASLIHACDYWCTGSMPDTYPITQKGKQHGMLFCHVEQLVVFIEPTSNKRRPMLMRQLGKHSKKLLLSQLAIEDAPEELTSVHSIADTMPCPSAPAQQQAWQIGAIDLFATEDDP